jgi:hypothetical protein
VPGPRPRQVAGRPLERPAPTSRRDALRQGGEGNQHHASVAGEQQPGPKGHSNRITSANSGPKGPFESTSDNAHAKESLVPDTSRRKPSIFDPASFPDGGLGRRSGSAWRPGAGADCDRAGARSPGGRPPACYGRRVTETLRDHLRDRYPLLVLFDTPEATQAPYYSAFGLPAEGSVVEAHAFPFQTMNPPADYGRRIRTRGPVNQWLIHN